MTRMRAVVALLAVLLGIFAAPARAGTQAPAELCTGAYQGDERLGPQNLPTPGQRPVGPLLKGYWRTGGLPMDTFLAEYWRPATSQTPGGWRYPPDDGFATIDGRLDKRRSDLRPGEMLDRFGSVYGTFLAPAGDAYAKRSLPPQNLVTREPAYPCGYHLYRVVKSFAAWKGRIAAWFAQPGGGRQIQLDPALLDPGAGQRLNVQWLLSNGYLADATG